MRARGVVPLNLAARYQAAASSLSIQLSGPSARFKSASRHTGRFVCGRPTIGKTTNGGAARPPPPLGAFVLASRRPGTRAADTVRRAPSGARPDSNCGAAGGSRPRTGAPSDPDARQANGK